MSEATYCPVPGCLKVAERKGYCRNHLYRLQKYGNPLAGNPTPGTLAQWVMCHKDHNDDECLFWPYHRTAEGYAHWTRDGVGQAVHIFMCEHRNGPRPTPQHHAAHICGKGRDGCVNPAHMMWKTPKENEADKETHGTRLRGERHAKAKLTPEQILAIRKAHGKQRDIAKQFGITQANVWFIKARRTWGHVSD